MLAYIATMTGVPLASVLAVIGWAMLHGTL